MANPFERTLRSLDADSFSGLASVTLIVSMVLFLIWMAWFTIARVAMTETSEPLTITNGEYLAVEFPAAGLGKIRRGQPAAVLLWQDGQVPAVVVEAVDDPVAQKVHAQMMAFWPDGLPQVGSTAVVRVEVERVSPATLVMRAATQSE